MSETSPEQLKAEGMQQFRRGAHDQALATFEAAAAAFAAQNDELGQAEMLNNVGVIHRVRRNYAAAHAALGKAMALFAQRGDTQRQAAALGNIGDVFAAEGDRETAVRCYSDAAELFAGAGDRQKQGQMLRALSLLRLRQGQWLAAMRLMEESLSVRPRMGPGGWLFRSLLRFALRLLTGA